MVRRVVVLVLGLLTSGPAQAKVWPEKPRLEGATPLETTAKPAPPSEAPDAKAEVLPVRHLPLADRLDFTRGLAEILPGAALTARGVRLRGGTSPARLLDGFRLYRLQPPLPFYSQVGLLAAGYGVDLADVPEGAIVLQSHQPSPALRADLDASYESNRTVIPASTLDSPSFASPSRREQSLRVVTGTVAAPVIHDRLFLTGFLGRASNARDGEGDPQGILPDSPESSLTSIQAGLTATLILGDHRLDALALGTTQETLNGGDLSLFADAQPFRRARTGMAGLRWSAKLSEVFSAHLQLGSEHHTSKLESMLCRKSPDRCEQVPAVRQTYPRTIVLNNSERFERWNERHWQLSGGVEARLDGSVQHRLRLSARLETGAFERQVTTPGGQVTLLQGTVPANMTSYYANDPRLEPGVLGGVSSSSHTRQTLVAIEDQLAIAQRFFVTPGLGVVSGHVEGAGNTLLLSDQGLVFHLGAGAKLSRDGRTYVRASSSRRFDPSAERAAQALPDGRYSRTCAWDVTTNSYTRDCVNSGGSGARSVGLPCGPSGRRNDGSSCASEPQMPTVWEHALGLRQAFAAWGWFDLDLVYRRVSDLHLELETNRLWNQVGVSAYPNGFRNGRNETVLDFSSSSQLFRDYRGATASIGLATRGLRGLVAYTYARQEVGDFHAGAGVPLFFRHDDLDEVRHAVRLVGSYVFPWASFAMVYGYDSGTPGVPASYLPAPGSPGSYENYRARVGINPGTDLNDPADDVVYPRNRARTRLDLQARFRPGHWLPLGMDFYADVINAFGLLEDSARVEGGLAAGVWVRVGTELRY